MGQSLIALAARVCAMPLRLLRQRVERLLQDPDAPWQEMPDQPGELHALSVALEKLVAQSRERQRLSRDMLARLEAVLEYAQVGVAFSRLSHFELVSRHYCLIFGVEQADVIGKPTRVMYASEEAYEALSARARPAFMQFGAFEGELELVRANGAPFWAHMRGRAVVPGNLAAGTIWIIEDVTQAREQRERLTWTANHDALTGLANRLAFEGLLGQANALAGQTEFSALFIDLDRFKAINDSAGHAAGDALLKGVAECLMACVRQSDTVARLGGDEFAVLLPRCPATIAMAIAEKVRKAVEGFALLWEGQHHTVGASIGVVHVNGQYATSAEVLRAADTACYAAKHAGRNQVVAHGAALVPMSVPLPEPVSTVEPLPHAELS